MSCCEIIISVGLKELTILKTTIYCESFIYISKLYVPFWKKIPWKTLKILRAVKMELPQKISSVAKSWPTLCDTMDCSMPGFPIHHQLPELTRTHAHWVGDTIKPSHSLLSLSPPKFNLSQHQDLFKWVSSSHQVAKVLTFQL